ncbi:hypothetical protein DSO57_1021390 [Entomophthora muscae]|uniref:Uncharacterized protein n=1 Tax=Entomophthora muscae TaxID=34485 RepID=A0ACC2S5A9_9FUNG|nr:hypothetical protein DSO57_1021390 [Entomophthora muscae]
MAFSTASSCLSTKEEYQEFLATMSAERCKEFSCQSKEARHLQFYGWRLLRAHNNDTCSELSLATTVMTNPFKRLVSPILEQEAKKGDHPPLVVGRANWATPVDPEVWRARTVVPCTPAVPYIPDLALLGSVVLTYGLDHADFEVNSLFQGYELLSEFLFVLLSCGCCVLRRSTDTQQGILTLGLDLY